MRSVPIEVDAMVSVSSDHGLVNKHESISLRVDLWIHYNEIEILLVQVARAAIKRGAVKQKI